MTAGVFRAFLRLFVVQGAWNYERMLGVGLGYAAEPLLEDLKSVDPGRHAEASVRSAEYFNSHPYLAGVALGALVRAEYDQLPAAHVGRLRAALVSPLGALGDQLFWVGVVPALMGAATLGVVTGHGIAALVLVLVIYNLIRVATAVWALRTGLMHGARVGMALGESWLPRAVPIVGQAAAVLVGTAIPLAADWLLQPHPDLGVEVVAGTMLVALFLGWRFGTTVTSVRFGLTAIGLAVVAAWGLP